MKNTIPNPQFRFTTDPGSALLYYGDEFVAKFSSQHRSALAAVLVANEVMREEIDAFTKRVGAPSFQEAVDVTFRSVAQNMDQIETMFNQIKKVAAERDEARVALAAANGVFDQITQSLTKERDAATDHLDLALDELARIAALTTDDEIKGMCQRGQQIAKQNLPVIKQRDDALAESEKLRRQLQKALLTIDELNEAAIDDLT